MFTWQAILSGAQETPPNASPATGSGSGTYDDITNLLTWTVTYSGLVALRTAAHFHNAPPGVNGPVQYAIGGAGPMADTLIGMVAITDPQEVQLLAGNWYLNVHSTTFPGGEIRGQVSVTAIPEPIPEPATASLCVVALLGALVFRRRFGAAP